MYSFYFGDSKVDKRQQPITGPQININANFGP